jgi:hypothetical protein
MGSSLLNWSQFIANPMALSPKLDEPLNDNLVSIITLMKEGIDTASVAECKRNKKREFDLREEVDPHHRGSSIEEFAILQLSSESDLHIPKQLALRESSEQGSRERDGARLILVAWKYAA